MKNILLVLALLTLALSSCEKEAINPYYSSAKCGSLYSQFRDIELQADAKQYEADIYLAKAIVRLDYVKAHSYTLESDSLYIVDHNVILQGFEQNDPLYMELYGNYLDAMYAKERYLHGVQVLKNEFNRCGCKVEIH